MSELVEIADALYAETPEAFTAARNAAAKQAKDAGDKERAAELRSLKKPSIAAWAVNLLVRRESEQIDAVLELADSLRAAAQALDGEELRALNRQRRQLTSALANTARDLAAEEGSRLTMPVLEQVEAMLTAAMLDPVAAEVLRTGRVLTGFSSTGLGELDPALLVALPDRLDVGARPTERAAPDLRVVPDDAVRREQARDALVEAQAALAVRKREQADARAAHDQVQARVLQRRAELDELHGRIASIESELEGLEDSLEEKSDAQAEADRLLELAHADHDRAENTLREWESGT